MLNAPFVHRYRRIAVYSKAVTSQLLQIQNFAGMFSLIMALVTGGSYKRFHSAEERDRV